MTDKQTTDLQANTASDDKTEVKQGRPTTYSETIGALICERISAGETLTAICSDYWLPTTQTVYRWRRKFPNFGRDYLRAREAQAEIWADDCIMIADDSTCDTVTKTGRNGATYEAVDHEHIQRSKLRVDTRFRIMAATHAQMFGDRTEVKHSGTIEHEHTVASLSDREKMRRLALFMLEDKQAEPIEGQAIEQPEPIESQ